MAAALHNRVSQKELKALLYQETEPRTTLSFYRYFPITDPQKFRDELYAALNEKKVFGRIYIATEGINAQISVRSLGLRPPVMPDLGSIDILCVNHGIWNVAKNTWEMDEAHFEESVDVMLNGAFKTVKAFVLLPGFVAVSSNKSTVRL